MGKGKKYDPENSVDSPQAGSTGSPQASAAVLDYSTWKDVKSGLHLIPLELVVESPDNARKHFDSEELGRLAASIAVTGGVNTEAAIVKQIDPFLLPTPDEAALGPMPIFELVSGHRRFRALQLNGANFIKAEVKEFGGNGDRELSALVCNLHRADLNPIEKSDALQKMVAGYKTVEHLAKAVAIHSRTVQDLLNLQRLIPPARTALIEGKITTAHAVLISREQDASDQTKCLDACFRPEAIDNGGGMEMVPKLISEKQLRDWIKDNLRPEPVEQPKLFGTEEERREDARNAESERKADAILDANGADVGRDDVDADEAGADDARQADAGAKSEESDITDDDLTPDQAAAVKPEDGSEYLEEQARRAKLLREVSEYVNSASKENRIFLFNQMAQRIVPLKAKALNVNLFCDVMGAGSHIAKYATHTYLRDLVENGNHETLLRVICVMCFWDDLNPNNASNLENCLESLRRAEPKQAKAAKPKAKSSKSPSPSEVSKVMKAEKAKLAKKSGKSKKPAKSKR